MITLEFMFSIQKKILKRKIVICILKTSFHIERNRIYFFNEFLSTFFWKLEGISFLSLGNLLETWDFHVVSHRFPCRKPEVSQRFPHRGILETGAQQFPILGKPVGNVGFPCAFPNVYLGKTWCFHVVSLMLTLGNPVSLQFPFGNLGFPCSFPLVSMCETQRFPLVSMQGNPGNRSVGGFHSGETTWNLRVSRVETRGKHGGNLVFPSGFHVVS